MKRALCTAAMLAVLPACLETEITMPESCSQLPVTLQPVAGDTVTMESGLEYIVVEEGTGEIATAGDTVSVHYTGYLTDGRQFDSSRGGRPISFVLGAGQVIPGFDLGTAGIAVGGQRRLILSSSLAYGSQGNSRACIPPNATVLFDIELVSVAEADREAP